MKRILIENSITVKELNEGLKKVEGMQLISVDAGNDASDKGLFLDFKPVPIPKSGLTGFKEWLNKQTWNSAARMAEEMIIEFEKEQENKPRYLVDWNGQNRSWDIIDTQSDQKQVRSYHIDALGFDALHEAERDCGQLNGIGISKITMIECQEDKIDINSIAQKVTDKINNMMNTGKR